LGRIISHWAETQLSRPEYNGPGRNISLRAGIKQFRPAQQQTPAGPGLPNPGWAGAPLSRLGRPPSPGWAAARSPGQAGFLRPGVGRPSVTRLGRDFVPRLGRHSGRPTCSSRSANETRSPWPGLPWSGKSPRPAVAPLVEAPTPDSRPDVQRITSIDRCALGRHSLDRLLPQPAGSIQEGSIWPESSYSLVNCPVYIAVYRSWDAPSSYRYTSQSVLSSGGG
jgi:hypothetical protein